LETVKRIRTMRGMNQVDLAKASGVSQNTVSEIETGRREARPATLGKLAKALNVEIAAFFEEEDASPKDRAPGSPREWLRAHVNAQLLSLTEEELAAVAVFAALYSDVHVKFADRIDREWQAVEMARDLAPDPNAQIVHEAHVHATSRYIQAKGLAPISTSYDPDDPEKPEQVTLIVERPKSPAPSKGDPA
jgi:transcriptional regulator with XRE-family HTH domain